MSCMESKMLLRVEIEELKGDTVDVAYAYFKAFLGEADDVDVWEGKIEYFSYDEEKHDMIPVRMYDGNRWGIDYILNYYYDGNKRKGKNEYTLEEIIEVSKRLSRLFRVKLESIKLHSYEWYNGADEPVKF